MYKIIFYKDILDGELVDIKTAILGNYLRNNPDFDPDNEFHHRTSIERKIELPFPPFIGLTVIGDFVGHHLNTGKIIEVNWHNDDQCFVCFLKNEFPLKSNGYVYDHDYYLNRALETGWTCIHTSDDD